MNASAQFQKDADVKVFDVKHRETIKFNMAKYNAAVQGGLTQYENGEAGHPVARDRAAWKKNEAIQNLDRYLIQFEERFTARGGKVIWARDKEEALAEILKIFQRRQAKLVVKSKSMTSEEIELNEFLEHHGVEPVETDLGEWIVQMAGQRPYHIVTPAMHMNRHDISALFVEKLKVAPTDDPQELTMIARRLLREKYTTADIGITGGNFLVADVGAVAVTENEGNARLTMSFPKTLISIVGIEKVLPKLEDLDTLWPILATHGTGQQVTVYNTLLGGPRQAGETDGPEEMYVVLLDNGRTTLLKDEVKRQALRCIRCGACLNACPVYKNVGGHTYETTYSGPIGSIISPHYLGMKDYKHLSYASSLCGACTSVCPVRIDIAEMLLLNRKEAVDRGFFKPMEKLGFKIWTMAMKHRMMLNIGPGGAKSTAANTLFKSSWGKHRSDIKLAPKNFNQLWRERRGTAD